MLREYERPNASGAWDFQAVADYLTGKGYLIGPAGIGTALDVVDGVPTVLVRVDLDANVPEATLAADLDAYKPPPDPVAAAQVAVRRAVAEIRANNGKATVDERLARLEAVVVAYALTRGV